MSRRGMIQSKRKSGGGGIGSLISGLTGAGALEGGGFTEGFDADQAARDEFKGRNVDPTDEDANFDTWNEIRTNQATNGIVSKAPGFTPYKVQNPILDSIFNKGQGAAQANQYNFTQGQSAAEMNQRADLARKNNEASYIRQNMGDESETERQLLRNKSAMSLAEFGHNSGIASKAGVMTKGFDDLQNTINNPNTTTAGNIAQIRSKNSSSPRFSSLVQANQEAEQMALPSQVYKNSQVDLAPNSATYIEGFDGYQPSMMLNAPSQNQHVEMTGGIRDPKTGQMMYQKPEVVTTRNPANVINYDDVAAKEAAVRARLAQPRVGTQVTPMPSNPSISNNPSGFPVGQQSPANTALLPRLGQGIKSKAGAVGDYINPLGEGSAVVDLIRKLIDSNYKVKSKKPLPSAE